MKTKYVS